MWRWLKERMTPQQVDVDAMLSSAPLGSIDFEVAELTQRITHGDCCTVR